MSVTNYTTLQTAVGNWLNRGDLSTQIPEFIQMAEGRFLRDPRVRDFANDGAVITPLSGSVTTNWLLTGHPDVYLYGTLVETAPYLKDDERVPVWKAELEQRLAELATSRLDMSRTLSLADYAGLQGVILEYLNRPDLSPLTATFISLAEASLKRDLAGAATITALSSGANWLFTSHPDVYLYASLCEAAPWLGEDARLATWKALRDERVAEVLRTRTATAYDLTTYAGLQTAIKGWLNRTDIDPAALIVLAEATLKRTLAGAPTITALSAGVNWLFSSHPDVYLYASLVEASPYLGEDARVPLWKATLDERVGDVLRSRTATAYTLTTYAGLQTAIKGWLDRQDVDAVAFIDLAEASLARDERLKKLKSAAFSITTNDLAVPTDFHALQSWYHDGPTYYGPIEIVGAEQLGTLNARYGSTGAPAQAAILDGKFRFAPAPDSTYATKMTYWRTLGSAAAGSSWLFTASPDIYLYAALVEGAPYAGKDPTLWAMKLDAEIEKVRRETNNTHFSGTMRRQFKPIGG